MRWCTALAVFGLLVLSRPPIEAEEPPYRDFVQGLREKHYADLAEEYLDQLSHQKLPPEVAAILPLEMARTRVARAQDKSDPGQRLALYNKAREDFTAFLKANPPAELAAEVNFDLARLIRLQGHVQLLLAQQQDAPEAQRALKLKARAQLEEAAGSLEQAAKQLADQLAKHDSARPEEKARKRALASAKLQADLERGLDVFDQLRTYDDPTDDPAKRTDVAQQAIDILKRVAAKDDTDPLCWKAKAWLMRAYQEIDSPDEPRRIYTQIVDRGGAPVEVQRLAKYFFMLGVQKEVDDPKVNQRLASLAEKWLAEYRADHNTPEGYGVRYLLAETYFHRALHVPKPQQNGPAAQELYARAEKLYAGLEKTENEFTHKAREGKLNIIITRSEERSKGNIDKLKNFDECYIRARLEIARMNEEDKDKKLDAKKRKQQRQAHFHDIVHALERALDLADDKTAVADQVEARYLLAYAYLATGQPYQAAVTGEFLAHSEPASNHSATAAAYALGAYSKIIGDEERGDNRDPEHDEEVESDRARLKSLALYMEKTWPDDPATDVARHELGAMAIRQKNYPEAVAALARIKPTYADYTITQYDLAVAAQEAAKENAAPPKGQPSYQEQAIAALKKLPELGSGANPVTAQFYVKGKLKLAQMLFEKKQYKQMAKVSDHVREVFAKAPLADNVRQEFQAAVDAQPFYADYGQADVAFRAGKYAEALKRVDPFVKQFQQDKLGWLKDMSLIRGMLGLALRADVQQGNKDQAKAILDLLQKKGAGSFEGGATAILVDLVQQLKSQVDDLRKKGKPAEAQLQQTIKSFSEFLDELAKRPPKTLTPEIVRFLAFSYASLDEHAKAADLLKQIPKPGPSHAADKDKRAREDQEKAANYHSVRLLYCRELRLSKQFDDAARVLKEVMATGLGKRSLDARKEQIMLMEDKGQHMQAAKEWNKLMKDLRPRLSDNKLKDQYFEAYYQFVYSYYKYASAMKDENKKAANIKKAAAFITALESKLPSMGGGGLKQRYDELLSNEPALKAEYDALKKGAQ